MSMVDLKSTEQKIAERINPETAGNLAVSTGAGGMEFTNMAQALEFAKMMAVSSVAVPKFLRGNPGACLAVVIQAIEWKLSPYAVANKSYSVNDRLAFESQLIQAVILQRAPIQGRFNVEYLGEGNQRRCKVSVKLRNSGEVKDYTSPEIATIPVKNSPLWKGDPDQQLFYYSGRALCRRHFPDVLLGIYTPDELYEETHNQGPDNARDVTPVKGLSAKLDALALSGRDDHAHDPDTGEIKESADAADPEANTAATEEDRPAPTETSQGEQPGEVDERSPEERLLDDARSHSLEGRKAFDLWFNAQKPDQCDQLRPHMAALMAGARAVDEQARKAAKT